MDFVGADDEVVFLGDFRVARQFVVAVSTADGVVRVAEEQEAGVGADVGFQGGEVRYPAAVFLFAR